MYNYRPSNPEGGVSRIIAIIAFVFSLVLPAPMSAQTYEAGRVLKWESRSYSQSAHITRNQIVYWVQVSSATYQIANRRDKPEMAVGQQVKCRVEKNHLFVLNEKAKETKYDIVGVDSSN
jgi:hypothetical protein